MNTWFTSDTHYGHKNISSKSESRWTSGYRDFSSLEEMNKTIIQNINDCVKEEDILYHIGDWSFGGQRSILAFRNSLLCQNIHLIKGNHDEQIIDKEIILSDGTIFNPYQLFKSVNDSFSGYIGKTYFHLSHYAHLVWPKSHKGSICLFGHSHGSLQGVGRSMDIGIDTHKEFRPYHINEILEIMSKKKIHEIDHHK